MESARGLVVDETHVYWMTTVGSYRTRLDGSDTVLLSNFWSGARHLVQTDEQLFVTQVGGDSYGLRVYAVAK